jgi:purine-binding chemotaxis protein CheW
MITADLPVHKSGRYLTFRIARQDFAISADPVRGILPLHEMDAMEVPHPWLCGYAAIAGHDFPVVDLRAKFELPHGSRGREPFIIVIEARGRLVGFIADRVSEVIDVRQMDFRNNVVRGHGRPRKVLEPERVLTDAEWPSPWLRG